MTLTEVIDYIEREWPDIHDANSCARWILGQKYRPQTLDNLCCFWMRHEHD